MSRTLSIRNRQQIRPVHTALLRRITRHIIEEQLGFTEFELALHLVAAREMARLNETFLRHEGSTDVITFDYADERAPVGRDPAQPETECQPPGTRLHGEIFICLDDAVKQARQFRTTWQTEVARYVIHGLLHLCGHDDLKASSRRLMKREENRLLRDLGRAFALRQLETGTGRFGTAAPASRPRRSLS